MTEIEASADSANILASVIARRSAAGLGVKVSFHGGSTFTAYCANEADRADFVARACRSASVAKAEAI